MCIIGSEHVYDLEDRERTGTLGVVAEQQAPSYTPMPQKEWVVIYTYIHTYIYTSTQKYTKESIKL